MASKLLIYWSNCCSCFCQIFVFVLCLGLEANVQRVLLSDSKTTLRPAKKATSYEKKSNPLGVQKVSVILSRLSIIKLKVCKCSSNVANCRHFAAEKIFVSFWPFKPGLPTVWTEICWWDIVCCLNNFWLLAAKFSMSLKSRQKNRTNLPISGGGQFYLSATVGQLEVDNEVNWRRACVLDRCWEQTPRCRNASNDLIGVYQNQAEPIFSLILCFNRSLWQGLKN